MRRNFIKPLVLRVALLLALSGSISLWAISAANLSKALDYPAGIIFITSEGSWTLKTGTVSGANIKNVPSAGSTYLEGKAPDKDSPQKESRFRFKVQGAGTLHFRYQVSLDYYNDSELCLYMGNYEDGCLWWDSDTLDNSVEPGEAWWLEDEVYFGGETYTKEAVFAILGPDSEYYEKLELDAESGEKLDGKAWLDKFVWEPDEDMHILYFEPDPEMFPAFDEWEAIYLESDYDNVVFRYTTDGSIPTLESPIFDPYHPIIIEENTTISVCAYEGNTKIGEPVYRASYQLMTSRPTLTLQQEDFSDSAILSFESKTPGAQFYYTRNNQIPIRLADGNPGENTFTGNSLTLANDTVIQVMAYADGLAESLPVVQNYVKQEQPIHNYEVDHNPNNQYAYFDWQVAFTLSAAEGSRVIYEINGVRQEPLAGGSTIDPVFNETTQLRFQAQQEGNLHSRTVTLNFYKTVQDITLAKPEQPGWHLFFLPGEVSQGTSQGLIQNLQPFAYDSQKKGYARPKILHGGQSYWYFVANPDNFQEQNFKVAPVALDLQPQVWTLGYFAGQESVNAWLWNLNLNKYREANADADIGAGWLFKQK
ncbi:MAG: hypothetical protein GX946_05985 [Oligosphaeraceae bacterium]|nr:hypothetical protein [Oligosphaeraceae bacterium]